MNTASLPPTKSAFFLCFLSIAGGLISGCSESPQQLLITIADARKHPAVFIDTGTTGDSIGDILSFEQPLLNKDMIKVGVNSGTCIRTHIAKSFQCQWTLTFSHGSIQIAGREYDAGSSVLSIVGGTGTYYGITGEMTSTKNADATFTQTLRYNITN